MSAGDAAPSGVPPDVPAEVPQEIRRLAEERRAARERRDWAAADALRDRLADAGWQVADTPEGPVLTPAPAAPPADQPIDPASLRPMWDEPDRHAVSVVMHVTGWPDDVARAVAALDAGAGGVGHEVVIVADGCSPADLAALAALARADEQGGPRTLLPVEPALGFGAAMNLAMGQATGAVVVWLDAHVEAEGDLLTPLLAALRQPGVGLAGGWGVVTTDLREFSAAEGPEVDAVEGYLLALPRPVAAQVQVDPGFRWYRNADLDYSFAVRALGKRAVVVDVPAKRHRHRGWHETAAADRDRLSRRNYRRFLDRWRDRTDLLTLGGSG